MTVTATAPDFAERILEHARLRPTAPALVWRGRTVDYAELADLVHDASLCVRSLGARRPIGLLGRKSPQAIALILAGVLARRPVFVPSPDLAPDVLNELFHRAGCSHVIRPGEPAVAASEVTAVRVPGPDARLDAALMLTTSGSTGTPKAVVTTHRMLCSNQRAIGQVWPFLHEEPPVLVDWLPWSHTFGGSHNLGQVLAFGGTLHIDDGKPVPGLFDRTLEALREVRPTVYYNVPAAWALLAPALESDPGLAEAFFSRLRFMFYAAAALPEALWDRLRALADRYADRPVPLTASWGTTETAPAATAAHFEDARCGCIGVPIPGTTLKLVPSDDRLEIRVAGPNITPGYHADPATTAAAFDEEGFYRTGDAARLVDPEDPSQGLVFDGRLAENFKLLTGTWVSVGALRTALVSAAGGVLRDAVIAGHDREYVAALAWVDPAAARRLCETDADAPLDHPVLTRHLERCLASLNERAGTSATIARLMLLDRPPDMDAGEITDKGYVNQRAVLEGRRTDVARVFAEPPPPGVLVAPQRVPPTNVSDQRAVQHAE
jgi:feruloyl-CoA synthase